MHVDVPSTLLNVEAFTLRALMRVDAALLDFYARLCTWKRVSTRVLAHIHSFPANHVRTL
jgi:hypothetical protein